MLTNRVMQRNLTGLKQDPQITKDRNKYAIQYESNKDITEQKSDLPSYHAYLTWGSNTRFLLVLVVFTVS